jgi:DNA-binding MarR family transcriptional regulator
MNMARPKHRRTGSSPEQRQVFWDFIHQVSPEADPMTIMLFGQVMKARNLLAQTAERDLGAGELTWAEMRLLMNLLRQERCSGEQGLLPSELSELLGISPNTVSALINNLEAAGYITRELHPRDHRKFVIRLTPSSRAVLKTKLHAHLQCVSHCFDALNSQERETLSNLLSRLNVGLTEKAERTVEA